MAANLNSPPTRLLIVGCGNPLAGDDSAGIEIVRRLTELGECGCDLRAETAPGVGLLELFPGASVAPGDPGNRTVILIADAVTAGGPAGTLYLASLPSADLQPRALNALSGHGWGLREVLQLARALGRTIPRLFLLGIEPATVAPGAPRSDAVEHALTLVVERIFEIKALLLNGSSAQDFPTRSFPPGDPSFPGS